jgi:hypothetical protein
MDKQAAVEATMDVIDPVFDTIEAVPEVVKNNPIVLASVAVVSASIGATIAVVVTRRILKTKYERLITEEVREARAYYSKRFKTGEFADPTVLAEGIEDEAVSDELNPETAMIKDAVKIMETQEYVSYDKKAPKSEPTEQVIHADVSVQQNIFKIHSDDSEFDLDAELDKKSAGKPYIIEVEEFLENDAENTQVTLTWYEGDGVMVDDRDQAVRNHVGAIGEENLKFGYGSKDPNTVYIRNDRFKADYEIIRSEQKYAEVVHGFREPKARMGKTRKFPKDGD